MGTEQWPHSTAHLFGEAVPLIRREISPSMYKRNLPEAKSIENIFERDPNGPSRTPVQSAMAFPKNEPMWVVGFDQQ
jgi:hypothetical protein